MRCKFCIENFLRTSNEISLGLLLFTIYVIYYVTYSPKIQINCITLFLVNGLLSQFLSSIVNFIISSFFTSFLFFCILCFGCVPFIRVRFKQVVK